MECYRCGATLGRESFCPSCGTDVKVYKKIMQTSNAYYNQALSRAGVRDLSGAVESLKKSLRFNKKNIQARNLLGLVYFEMGETVSALSEWVISKNFKPENNIAGEYLDEIQKNRARLESINQTIKKYNQALLYCHQDSRDMAIIQLKKVLSMNPKMVQGHQLLGLLYLEEGNYEQAAKALEKAHAIDTNNTTTLRYMKELDDRAKASGTTLKDKNKKTVSYQSGNDTIIRPVSNFKESSSGSTVLNIAIGLIVGVLITCFLVVPGVRQSAKSNAKNEVLQANDSLSSKNQEIKTLQAKVDELNGKISDEQNSADSESKKIYDAVNSEVNSEYLASTYQDAYQKYSSLNYAEAAAGFQKIIDMDENYHDGYALYYLAQSYRKNNDIDNARTYYQKVVELYPNTERSSRAQKYLDEFGTAEADTANPDDAADENTRDTTTGDTGNTDIPGIE